MCIFEESQEPYCAHAWLARREAADRAAAEEGVPARFTSLDFKSMVTIKNLRTRDKVIAYVQESGTSAMQSFVSKNQSKLTQLLTEAIEWEKARANAAAEMFTDWALISKYAEEPCPHGDECAYAAAARHFFEVHASSFSMQSLAAAIRAVVVNGPTKHTKVPFLMGTTNTGKTTIIESFDAIFGESRVFHLPALTDTRGYALRNWMRNKRFVLWDEFEPVAYAATGVIPKLQFLKAFTGQSFEIQVSQSVQDGNEDFRWNRGAIFTAKGGVEIWKRIAPITDEDITHIRQRVIEFDCVGCINQRPGGVPQCPHCLAKWVCSGAAQHDAAGSMQALPPPSDVPTDGDPEGIDAFLAAARLPGPAIEALKLEVRSMGAVDVREVRAADWSSMRSFGSLREFEKRRLLALIPA